MANVEIRDTPGSTRRDEKTIEVAEGSSFAEGLAGVGVVVLAILALAGIVPVAFTAIATIAMGAALLFEGGAVAARLYKVYEATGQAPRETSAGISAEGIAGIAGIVLGILALVRVVPLLVLPVAAIVLGVGLILSSASAARVNAIAEGAAATTTTAGRAARESVYAASGAHAFVGLGAVVLGIIALTDASAALVLTQVAMLGLGAAVLLSGAALGGKLMHALHH